VLIKSLSLSITLTLTLKNGFFGIFDEEKAKEITERIESHKTPNHESWLSMAEINSLYWTQNASTGGFQIKKPYRKK
jgi:hypothetical protein